MTAGRKADECKQSSVWECIYLSVGQSGGKWGRREAEILHSNDSDALLLCLTVDYRTLWA